MYTPEPPYTDGLPPFDKYFFYKASVQSPDTDCEFLEQVYRDARGDAKDPHTMREDFCGTFANCCSWVSRDPKHVAHGVDLDPEPIGYGKANYLSELDENAKKRVHLHLKDVTEPGLPACDIICALNFSYFIFKERALLKKYFSNCLSSLKDDGLLVLDCFGGTQCWEPIEEETEFEDLDVSYYWDQVSFDPLSNEALFHIHFKRKGERKRRKVFTYDWRMWTVPELKDLLLEAGFAKVNMYWEGTTDEGEGDGDYKLADKGEPCESFVTYLVALK
jgi:SAM-dependent methyltransferase